MPSTGRSSAPTRPRTRPASTTPPPGAGPGPSRPGSLEELGSLSPPLKGLKNIPLYEVEAFTRHLDDPQWRWYSHDPATLRAADPHYRDPSDFKRSNFAYFDRKK